MRQFNTPPQWPQPPRPDWRPPRRWRPPASWQAAPAHWAFWIDEHGRAVRGPVGRYGGPRHITVLAMAVVPITLITLVLLNPFAQNETSSNEPLLRPSATAPTTPTASTMPVTRAPTRRTTAPVTVLARTPTPAPSSPVTPVFRNCAEARAAGRAPLHRGDPGYSPALDHNGDGVACDRGNS